METVKRFLKMELSPRELKLGKRILASVMTPILIFQMTSMNFLAMEMMRASAASGSGNMTVDPENVTAGDPGGKTFKFTFDPTEDMDGGKIEIQLPTTTDPASDWPDFSTSDGNGKITITEKSGADINGDDATGTLASDDNNIQITDGGRTLTIEIDDDVAKTSVGLKSS